MSHAEICPHCDQVTKGLSGAPKWCCYCGGKLAGVCAEDDSLDQWRRLALQFDSHRMQAIGWLKAILAKLPDASEWSGARAFLIAPPLSGEQVLAERIQILASRGIPLAVEALKSAQQNLAACRPYGSSDPKAPDYNDGAFMWDYYQRAIDALQKPSEDPNVGNLDVNKREVFEKYMRDHRRRGYLECRDGDTYADGYAHADWHLWKAAINAALNKGN